MVGDSNQGAGKDAVGGNDVRAVDPDMAGFEARGAAWGNLYRWETWRRGLFWHAVILNAEVGSAAGRVELALDDRAKWARSYTSKTLPSCARRTAGGGCPPHKNS